MPSSLLRSLSVFRPLLHSSRLCVFSTSSAASSSPASSSAVLPETNINMSSASSLANMSCADLCDHYGERAHVVDASLRFQNYGRKERFSGYIETVDCFEDNSIVKATLSQDGRGKVLVVNGGGSSRRSLVGDENASMAAKNGWEGVIVFGYVRDSSELAKIDFGVKALGTVPRKTIKKNVGEHNVKVKFGGTDFVPGDFVCSDSDGVITISKESLE